LLRISVNTDLQPNYLAADQDWMLAALRLARRGLGRVWPNPAVGCVLVRNGVVVGRGWTQPGGRPHAETEALRRAGALAAGATAYVSLEPCAHHGVSPPCVEALIAAGIRRAVIAIEDPDPRVSGRGVARLRAAGIAVTTDVAATEAAALNRGFLLCRREARPMFTLKSASSLDGRIATRSGDSRWISGELARASAHHLRATHDAVLVGSRTILTDDPELTCRLPGMERWSPVRVIADSRLRTPLTAKVVATAQTVPTWIVTRPDSDAPHRRELAGLGVRIIDVEAGADGRMPARGIARALARQGLTRVLIEGGGTLAAAFLREGLVDGVTWVHAPLIIGGDGIASAAAAGIDRLADVRRLVLSASAVRGSDVVADYSPAA
jgi:diaminohydroxyphosphoribosylaminopyrimidine deaminase/5-amino-6-(5-phosphoribosylamino)uracil reductase